MKGLKNHLLHFFQLQNPFEHAFVLSTAVLCAFGIINVPVPWILGLPIILVIFCFLMNWFWKKFISAFKKAQQTDFPNKIFYSLYGLNCLGMLALIIFYSLDFLEPYGTIRWEFLKITPLDWFFFSIFFFFLILHSVFRKSIQSFHR